MLSKRMPGCSEGRCMRLLAVLAALCTVSVGCEGSGASQSPPDLSAAGPADLGIVDLGAVDLRVVDLAINADLSSFPDLSAGAVGHACSAGSECATDYCLTEANRPIYVGGYCTSLNCDPVDGGCPIGSDCSGGGAVGATACFVRCTDHGDCRIGYRCCPDFNQVKVCAPPGSAVGNC